MGLLALVTSSAEAGVRHADRRALRDLFILLDGKSWKAAERWDLSGDADPCEVQWYGVGCDDPCDMMMEAVIEARAKQLPPEIKAKQTTNPYAGVVLYPEDLDCREGRITSIELRANGLRGDLSKWTSVGQLRNLSILDLSHNGNLTGSLPTEMGKLRDLVHLDVSGNDIEGHLPDLAAVNSYADGLFKLDTLNVAANRLSGTLPTQLGLHTLLSRLDVNFNSRISGTLPTELGNLNARLEVIYARYNSIDGTLPTQLGRLSELRFLELANNLAISGTLPPALGGLMSLREFGLNENRISGSLPTELCLTTSLRQLFLSNNRLEGNLTKFWSMGQWESLITLDLYNNSMSGDVPPAITRLKSLRYLFLDQTHMGPLTRFYCHQRLPLTMHFGKKFNSYVFRDRYYEYMASECKDPWDVNLAFNPLSKWGQYAD